MFAARYIERTRESSLISMPPHPNLGIIVVIPCKDEPDLIKTLNALDQCRPPLHHVEVITVINHSESASDEIKIQNQKTKKVLEPWITSSEYNKIRYHSIGPLELRSKWAGAGLARKKGMDEAVKRFHQLNKPDGIIVSLDADTLVDQNYLTAIENHFINHPTQVGATIAFSHQRDGLSEKHRQGIDLYEAYMYYYKNALAYTGYPYPMFTIGSAFAVLADAYVKRGGMNRRQAGEDFYFLQNLTQLGVVGEINATTVYPSARISNRVPFGTGPLLNRWMRGEEDLSTTYNFSAFFDLKSFFMQADQLYKIAAEEYKKWLLNLPPSVEGFLQTDCFGEEVKVLNENCATQSAFKKRFFQKFNAFKILKFLNFAHSNYYQKASLHEQMQRLSVSMNEANSC